MSDLFDKSQPLWLPAGSVRALMTMGALVIAAILLIASIDIPVWFVGLITLVVNSYFNERSNAAQTAERQDKSCETK